jgi:hypothetical protein
MNERMNGRLKEEQKKKVWGKKKTKWGDGGRKREKEEEDGLTLGSLSAAVCVICKERNEKCKLFDLEM